MADTPRLVPFEKRPEPEPLWKNAEHLIAVFLDEIRSGKQRPVNMMVFFCDETPDGGQLPHYWYMGMTAPERVAFAEIVKLEAIEAWRG